MSSTNRQKHESPNPLQQKLLSQFKSKFFKTLETTQPTSILEMGAGEGFLMQEMHQRFPGIAIRGYDVDQTILADGQRLFPSLDLRLGDIYKIAEADNSWDVVIASEVLEHLERPGEALRELARVAKRYVLLSVPFEPIFRLSNLARGHHLARLGNHPEHINLWTKAAFQQFAATTLEVERATISLPWTIVLGRVR